MNWLKGMLNRAAELYQKYLPREHQVRDTVLHKIIGERLFDDALWKPEKRSIIHAVTMGIFVAFTPTIGIQMAIAGICAFLMRVNIPSAILMVWISNPVTAIPIYSMEIKVGFMVLGNGEGFRQIHEMKDLLYYIEPLAVGTLITSTFLAALAFIIMTLFWDVAESAWNRKHSSSEKT
jgi:uncharacterized protein (DUF2062 family)